MAKTTKHAGHQDKAKATAGSDPLAARRIPTQQRIHGVLLKDPYRWLEENGPKTKAWLALQDAHARKSLAALPLRRQLHKRLEELSYIDAVSPPIRRGRRYFFSRRHADKEKVVWYWRPGKRGKERVLIDPNTLSKDGSISLSGLSISWDGRKVAYKLSENAADRSTLHVMDVGSGEVSTVDVIKGARYAHASWTPNSDGFYYTGLPGNAKIPAAEMPGHAAIYFHRLGTTVDNDRLVHPKIGDPSKFLSPQLSRDGRTLLAYIHHGWTRTDVFIKDPRKPKDPFRPLVKGLKAHFGVHPHGGKLYLHTDYQADTYRLVQIDPADPAPEQWKEIIPARSDFVLEDVAIVGGHFSLLYLHKATSRLEVATLRGKILRRVRFSGLGSASGLNGHPDDDEAYFSFSSFTDPGSIFSTSVRKGGRKLHFKPKVPVDPRSFTTDQVIYSSKDGTKVSMFIIRRKDQPLNRTAPVLLTGYGGFNISIKPAFRALYQVWLEQGGMVAIPNLRGGGEYGEAWHRDGMFHNKSNTFDDFIGAAEYLIQHRYTSARRMVIRGGSNGGLLVGAAMVQRPKLFRAVACHVPLLDMLRYHLFGAGKTWISEYGSADEPDQFKTLLSYSPYQHIEEGASYPALLMMTADSDDRVHPMHARKFAAAIRHASGGRRPVLVRVEQNAGHAGGDMIKMAVAAGADELAFFLWQVK